MKSDVVQMKLVLKENMRFAELIKQALDFSELCLNKSDSLYPFALMSIDNAFECIFLDNEEDPVPNNMIEKLEAKVSNRMIHTQSCMAVVVYAISVVGQNSHCSDALMFSISDSSGANTMTIYPYKRVNKTIRFKPPYTCDFSN